MTKDEALDMALEFVESNHSGGPDAFELIAAIKQARSEPVQEPDLGNELTIAYLDGVHTGKKMKREWVGLTDEEWQDLSDRYGMILFGRFKNEIETKLREKNTP